MNKVSKSIGWANFTINPVKGLCPVDCKDNQGKSYCYARRLYARFGWNPDIEWCPRVFRELDKLGAGSRVFIGSTMELFGPWVKGIWMKLILEEVLLHPACTFIFVTKKPEELKKWSPFPENVWCGVSATNHNELADRWGIMRQVSASVKFVSLEPLLDWADVPHRPIYAEGIINSGIQWVIIGQCTPIRKATTPKIGWVKSIVEAADKAGCAVFLKENLRPLLIPEDTKQPNGLMDEVFWADEKCHLLQEFPNA